MPHCEWHSVLGVGETIVGAWIVWKVFTSKGVVCWIAACCICD